MILLIFTIFSVTTSIFLLYEDGTMAEYSSAVFGTLSPILAAFLISTLTWKTEEVYELIYGFEDAIQKREFFCCFVRIFEETAIQYYQIL